MRPCKRRRYDEKLEGMPAIHNWKILRYADPLWCFGVLKKVNRNWKATVERFIRFNKIKIKTIPHTVFRLHFMHIRGGDFIAVAPPTDLECFYIYAEHLKIVGLEAKIRTVGSRARVYHRGYTCPTLLKIRGNTIVSAK